MTVATVRRVEQDAIKLTGPVPNWGPDNGNHFTAKDFKQLVRDFELDRSPSGRITRSRRHGQAL